MSDLPVQAMQAAAGGTACPTFLQVDDCLGATSNGRLGWCSMLILNVY